MYSHFTLPFTLSVCVCVGGRREGVCVRERDINFCVRVCVKLKERERMDETSLHSSNVCFLNVFFSTTDLTYKLICIDAVEILVKRSLSHSTF